MYAVKSPQKIDAVLRLCRLAAGTVPTARHVPFETPCSIDRDTTLPPLEAVTVSPKADGTRFYLALQEDGLGRPIASMVSRNEEVLSLRVQAPRAYFSMNTVLDGELCDSQRGKLFLVFNVLMYQGLPLFGTPYRNRLARLAAMVPAEPPRQPGERAILGQRMVLSATPGLEIVAKPCLPGAHLADLLATLHSTPFETDGVIFTPLNLPMCTGRNRRLLKWKEQHTIDLRLVVHSDNRYQLYAARQGIDVPLEGVAPAYSFTVNVQLDRIVQGFRLHRKLSGAPPTSFSEIVELAIHINDNDPALLDYVRVRRDKLTPNDEVTVTRTFTSAESKIDGDQLLLALNQVCRSV
jgi:hypothetical protein